MDVDKPIYLTNIPSLQTNHPELPAAIGPLNLDDDITTSQPILGQNLIQARAVATTFKAIKSTEGSPDFPPITKEHFQASKLRVKAIEINNPSDTLAKYAAPGDYLQAMDLRIDETNKRLDQIDECIDEVIKSLNGLRADVARITAVAHNSLVIGSNHQVQTGWEYKPLQKMIEGHGLAKAQACIHQGANVDDLNLAAPLEVQ